MLLLVRLIVGITITMAISSGSQVLPAVDVLSDEESPNVVNSKQVKGVKRHASNQHTADRDYIRRRTARLLGSSCRCSRLAKSARASCFKQFTDMAKPIVDLRVELAELHKLDSDQKAKSGLKPQNCSQALPNVKCMMLCLN